MHGKRHDGSQVVDAVLVRTRHSGFLQDLINTSPTPAMCTHRSPTRADGLTRALTASKYSLLQCRDAVRSCLRSPRYFFPEHLVVSNDETVTLQKKIVPANHHWKRTRESKDTSVQNILKVAHMRTYMLVLFSLASKHSPLHLREVVRSQDVEEHCVRSGLRTL